MIKSLLDEFQILMGLNISYMPEEYREDIFHYTSPVGFKSILFDDKEAITLWASRFDCQNDVMEGRIVLSVFKEVCDEMKKIGELGERLYDLIYDLPPTRTHLFIRFDKKGSPIFTRPECDRYITCFSKNNDSLAMWNYYTKGNRYEGYNIGFSPEEICTDLEKQFSDSEIDVKIYQVVYDKDIQKSIIRKLLLKLEKNYEEKWENQIRYIVSNQLFDWSLVFKSEYFQHEEEVRIITYVAKRTKGGKLEKSPIDIKYRDSFGLSIPYIVLKVDKALLKSVYIGPLYCEECQKQVQKNIMNERLFYNGYEEIAIRYSNIPVRY